MKKSIIAVATSCALLVSCVGMASAASKDDNCYSVSIDTNRQEDKVVQFEDLPFIEVDPERIFSDRSGAMTRATSRIEWNISPNTIGKADTAYSLEADEVVTINCTYSPRTADLDFGFITPDDVFHFTSGSNGNINVNIEIQDTGKYYFAVRNNTSRTVEILGYVYY